MNGASNDTHKDSRWILILEIQTVKKLIDRIISDQIKRVYNYINGQTGSRYLYQLNTHIGFIGQ